MITYANNSGRDIEKCQRINVPQFRVQGVIVADILQRNKSGKIRSFGGGVTTAPNTTTDTIPERGLRYDSKEIPFDVKGFYNNLIIHMLIYRIDL
jgi:hypothetical protein